MVRHLRCVFINYNWITQLSNTTIWWLDICCLLHRYQLYVSALMVIFRFIDWQQTCKQLYFGVRLVYGGEGLGLDGGTRSCVCWVGRVMWVHGYHCAVHGYYCAGLGRHNSTHAPTSPSLLNIHEISYPNSTPAPLHHTQDACQRIAAYKFCCQSINLMMAIRAETYSWYLCNKQHISNHQIVVFDSWLIQL